MNREEQLSWETRVGRLVAVAAFVSAVFLTTLLQGLSTALLAAPLWFLYKVTRFRREELQPLARYLALFAPPAAAILSIIRQIQVADISDKVVSQLSAN